MTRAMQDAASIGPGSERASRRRTLTRLAATIAAIVLPIALALGWFAHREGVGIFRRPFDPERWAAPELSTRERERRRWAMSANLVKRHLALGMTRAQVEALIGPPDPDPPLAPLQEGDRLYMLGPTPWETLRFTVWMLTDDDDELSQSGVGEASSILTWRALVVGFDAQDRLARFEITER